MHSRSVTLLPILLLTAACGDDTLTIHGWLDPGSGATDVYVVGEPIRAVIEADSFVIRGVTGAVAELEFAEGDDRRGRMRVEDWSGSPLELRRIWLNDGRAYPSAIGGEGAATVNGLRMASDGVLPERVSAEVVVLAASRRGDAMIGRPVEGGLPDLRIVVTPGTAVDPEIDDFDPEEGDRLWIEGATESGYVVATRIGIPPARGEITGDRTPPRGR